jgi:cytoskeleton protein RodZ
MKRLTRTDPAPGEAARLGEQLRDARLVLGLGIEDMAASLRIRRVYLVALEEGRLRDLPAPAYVLGFVRAYARALGLDDDEMVARFREASAGLAHRQTALVFPEPVPERGVPAGAVMLVGVLLAIGAYSAWYQWSGSGVRTVDAVPPLPPRLERVVREAAPELPAGDLAPVPGFGTTLPSPPNAASAAAATAPPASLQRPAAPPAATPPAEGRMVLRARADAWVQVKDRQGATVLNRVLKAGETWPVPGRDGLLLATGNAGGLDILVDGQPAAGLDARQAVRRDIPLDPERLKAGAASLATAAPPVRAPQ